MNKGQLRQLVQSILIERGLLDYLSYDSISKLEKDFNPTKPLTGWSAYLDKASVKYWKEFSFDARIIMVLYNSEKCVLESMRKFG